MPGRSGCLWVQGTQPSRAARSWARAVGATGDGRGVAGGVRVRLPADTVLAWPCNGGVGLGRACHQSTVRCAAPRLGGSSRLRRVDRRRGFGPAKLARRRHTCGSKRRLDDSGRLLFRGRTGWAWPCTGAAVPRLGGPAALVLWVARPWPSGVWLCERWWQKSRHWWVGGRTGVEQGVRHAGARRGWKNEWRGAGVGDGAGRTGRVAGCSAERRSGREICAQLCVDRL